MKKIKFLYLTIFMIMALTPISCKAQAPQPDIQTAIIGTWLAEDDPNVKLVFNSDGTYKTYYDNELTGTYTYSFSHQCGSESDEKAWFLKTIHQEYLDQACYEVYGANADNNRTLSMREMRIGKLFIYTKQ